MKKKKKSMENYFRKIEPFMTKRMKTRESRNHCHIVRNGVRPDDRNNGVTDIVKLEKKKKEKKRFKKLKIKFKKNVQSRRKDFIGTSFGIWTECKARSNGNNSIFFYSDFYFILLSMNLKYSSQFFFLL